ncbi:hypothetical protein K0U27_10440 [archaeon]|nr:hypothetical protein [archaeon]
MGIAFFEKLEEMALNVSMKIQNNEVRIHPAFTNLITDQQSTANNSGLRIDETISEIIQYYVIMEMNRKKFTQSIRLPIKKLCVLKN